MAHKILVERVAMRAAGYAGWEPPEPAEDMAPYELWEEAVKLFPHTVQQDLSDPDKDEDSRRDETTITLLDEVALSEDSGLSLSAVRTLSMDADEDGAYQHTSDKLDYTLWVDSKDWTGDTVARLRGHLRQFESTLKERDPEGYKTFLGR
jgi:hypothetical protein